MDWKKLALEQAALIKQLQARIVELEALLKAALEEIASLKERIAVLKKNSSNSSKPPSSDIVKPQKTSTPKTSGKKEK